MSTEVFNNTVFTPPTVHAMFYDPISTNISHFDGKVQNVITPATTAPATPAAGTAPTLSSGVATQNAASVAGEYYVSITGAASGTVKIDVGATSACTTNVVPVVTGNGVNSNTFLVKVPAAWYIKVTVVNCTIVNPVPVVLGVF